MKDGGNRLTVSLKLKLSLLLAVLLLATVGVLSELVLRGIERNQQERMEAVLNRQGQAAERYVRQMYLTGIEGASLPDPEEFMESGSVRMAQYLSMLTGLPAALHDTEGRETGSSLAGTGYRSAPDTLSYALMGKIAYETSGDAVVYYAPLRSDDRLLGVVRFHYSRQSDRLFLSRIRRLFTVAGLIVCTAGFGLGYLYVARMTGAIKRLRRTTGSIRDGRFPEGPPVRRRDELGDLGRDVFHMSEAIRSQLERQKQFIGNISHEFKTPLTSIKAYVDLLDMYRDDPELTRQAVSRIGQDAERLLEMVEKVLRLSAAGRYEFEQRAEVIELHQLLHEITATLAGKAERFGLKLETDLRPCTIRADRDNVGHLFVNLIDNAIKYTEAGGRIRVSVRTAGDEAVAEIADTGIGIPEDLRDRIFEPFYTVSRDRARSSGGTGLGLALVRQLAELQGGTVRLLKSGSEGSVFEVRLPLVRE